MIHPSFQQCPKTICKQQPTTVDYRWIPSAVFSMPPVASVGWTEAVAKEHQEADIETVCHQFTPLNYSLVVQKSPESTEN